MKHLYYGTLVFLFAVFLSVNVAGQCVGCVSDPQCVIDNPQGGICEDFIGPVDGRSFSGNLTFYIPQNGIDLGIFDTNWIGQSVVVDTLIIDSISGLFPGLAMNCAPGNCITYPSNGDSLSCVEICGTVFGTPYTLDTFWLHYTAWSHHELPILDTVIITPLPPESFTDRAFMILLPDTCFLNSCVWPGDANNDGIVDVFDLINISLAYDSVGPPRPDGSLIWWGQPGPDWGPTFPDGTDIKFADCTGDGLVNLIDVVGILYNYGRTHDIINPTPAIPGTPPITFGIPDTIYTNSQIQIDLFIDTSVINVDDLTGFAFRMDFDTALIQNESLHLEFDTNWFGIPSARFATIDTEFQQVGLVDGGAIWDLQGFQNDQDPFAQLTFGTIDNITGKSSDCASLRIKFNNIKIALNGVATVYDSVSHTTIICENPTTVAEFEQQTRIAVMPNPASGETVFHLEGMQGNSYNFTITNLNGQRVYYQENLSERRIRFNSSKLEPGMYFVEAVGNQKLRTRFLVIK